MRFDPGAMHSRADQRSPVIRPQPAAQMLCAVWAILGTRYASTGRAENGLDALASPTWVVHLVPRDWQGREKQATSCTERDPNYETAGPAIQGVDLAICRAAPVAVFDPDSLDWIHSALKSKTDMVKKG